ncbi:MAG TPA: hypothetical protein VG963_33085, partial [Polyangiaceae bacterium]|nr:hypothetical protein [Polyangiaceae bacterium]
VWTGDRMIVWGGRGVPLGGDARRLGSGAAYDPNGDRWTSLPDTGAPPPRFSHTAVWTGRAMLVWGGDASDTAVGSADGASYDPAAQRWQTLSVQNAPTPRYQHVAVWTGSEMIIWGGVGCGSQDRTRVVPCADGAAYRLDTDSWRELSRESAPPAKSGLTAVWTGSYMLVWGGGDAQGYAYDPRVDRWQPLPVSGAPRGRTNHVALWTGREMIVWGGLAGEVSVTDGGRLQFAQ